MSRFQPRSTTRCAVLLAVGLWSAALLYVAAPASTAWGQARQTGETGRTKQTGQTGDSSIGHSRGMHALARRLADESFEVRRSACEELLRAGGGALPALRAAARSNDLEARLQARRLMALIEESVYERKLAQFVAGGDVQLDGWKRFREVCGDDDDGRRMFVAMLRAEPELWRLCECDRAAAGREFDQRCREIEATTDYRRRREAPWETVCTLLLLAADEKARLEYQSSFTLYNLTTHGAIDKLLESPQQAARTKQLLSAWVQRGDASAAILRFQLAYRNRLPACLVPALELLRSGRETYVHHKAMLVVAKYGKAENLDDVLRYIGDATILYKRSNTGYTLQSRDAALVAAIKLSELEPADFGFEHLEPDDFHHYQYNSVGFTDDEKRAAAIVKWKQQRKQRSTSPK